MKTYRDLVIWQDSFALAIEVYKLTHIFPKEEMFNMTSQMRRASVSIPSNIAEGYSRSTENDFKRFITIAVGSLYEVHTQLMIAKKIGYLDDEDYFNWDEMMRKLEGRMLSFRKNIKMFA